MEDQDTVLITRRKPAATRHAVSLVRDVRRETGSGRSSLAALHVHEGYLCVADRHRVQCRVVSQCAGVPHRNVLARKHLKVSLHRLLAEHDRSIRSDGGRAAPSASGPGRAVVPAHRHRLVLAHARSVVVLDTAAAPAVPPYRRHGLDDSWKRCGVSGRGGRRRVGRDGAWFR